MPGDWLDADAWPAKARAQLAENAHTIIVLHDVLPGAMAHLDRFLGEVEAAGHRFTAALPADCVPIRDGVPGPGLAAFVRG